MPNISIKILKNPTRILRNPLKIKSLIHKSQLLENPLKSILISFDFDFNVSVFVDTAAEYDVPGSSSDGHDVDGGHGLLAGDRWRPPERHVPSRHGALHFRRRLSARNGPPYWLSTGLSSISLFYFK